MKKAHSFFQKSGGMTDIHEPEEEEWRIIRDMTTLLTILLPPGEHHPKVEQHSVGAPHCPDGQKYHTLLHVSLFIIRQTVYMTTGFSSIHWFIWVYQFQPFFVELEWKECFQRAHDGVDGEV